jgi:hypothetical protein
MRRTLMIMVAAAAVVASGAPAASAASTGAGRSAPDLAAGGWGTAEVVPGSAALNEEGSAGTASVSCPSAGNCAVGGTYSTLIKGHDHTRPFVDNETNGKWGRARQVPGMTALRVGPDSSVVSVSCASAGNCAVGGIYYEGPFDNNREAFVASEADGTWGTAQAVSGFPGNSDAELRSVSCGAVGDCSAGGGYYPSGGGDVQAFVVDETGGTWGAAEEVPGTAALNLGGNAEVSSVSCTSAGNCSAGGYYKDGNGAQQAFVVTETGGTWGAAKEVPGTATLDAGGSAQLVDVSCSAAGTCSAGGDYGSSSGAGVFVVSEKGGTWGTARAVAGTDELTSLSCASAGNCSAGGYYLDATTQEDYPFVVNQAHGTWGTAEQVPGITTINPTGSAYLTSLSCGAAGGCSAAGYYDVNGFAGTQAWVVTETSGSWGDAENIPGTSAGSPDGSGGSSAGPVSCATATHCVAGGGTTDSSGAGQAFVVSRT